MNDLTSREELLALTAAVSSLKDRVVVLSVTGKRDLSVPFLRAAARSVREAIAWVEEANLMAGSQPSQSIEVEESAGPRPPSRCICSLRFESYRSDANPHAHGPLCPRFETDYPNEWRYE